jgi:hypothetical protein
LFVSQFHKVKKYEHKTKTNSNRQTENLYIFITKKPQMYESRT